MFGNPLNVKVFGAKGNGKTDDTAAIQRTLNNAAKTGKSVVFPSGKYKISGALQVKVSKIVGQGYPELIQVSPGKDILFAPNCWRITIKGMSFRGGKDQISLGNTNVDQGFLIVSDCRFNYANGFAVRFRKGTPSSFGLVEKCAFRQCMQALHAVTDQQHLRDCWITSSQKMKNKAVIENYGVLTCTNILGVPLVNGNDQRWIDNYGTLTCRKFRFGGEGGGFTPVLNFAKLRPRLYGPKILIDDSYIGALGNNQRACAVYCKEIPNQITICNSSLAGVPAVIVDPKLNLKTYFNGVSPGMLLYDVARNTGEFAGKLPKEMIAAAKKRSLKRDYGKNQLSLPETKQALLKAFKAAEKIPSASPSIMKVRGKKVHKQQTEKSKYREITTKNYRWDLTDRMDGTSELNSEYLAVKQAKDDIVILRRISAGGNWPHVTIRNVKVDLNKFPFLAWRFKDNGMHSAGYAIKVTDAKTKKTVLLAEMHWKPFFDYRAYDLRKIFGKKKGVQAFDIKFYFLGICFKGPQNCTQAKKGDYLLVDFLRLESE
jgi:hypothetical protein